MSWVPYNLDLDEEVKGSNDNDSTVITANWLEENPSLAKYALLVCQISNENFGIHGGSGFYYGGGWTITNGHVIPGVGLHSAKYSFVNADLSQKDVQEIGIRSTAWIHPNKFTVPDLCLVRLPEAEKCCMEGYTSIEMSDDLKNDTKVHVFHFGVREDQTYPLQYSFSTNAPEEIENSSGILFRHHACTRPGSSGGLILYKGNPYVCVGGKLDDKTFNVMIGYETLESMLIEFRSIAHELATGSNRNRISMMQPSLEPMNPNRIIESFQQFANKYKCSIRLTAENINNPINVVSSSDCDQEQSFVFDPFSPDQPNWKQMIKNSCQPSYCHVPEDFKQVNTKAIQKFISNNRELWKFGHKLSNHSWEIVAQLHANDNDQKPHVTIQVEKKRYHLHFRKKNGSWFAIDVTCLK